jgi:hypothetical protein
MPASPQIKVKVGQLFRIMIKVVQELVEGFYKLETAGEVVITTKELEKLGIEVVLRKKGEGSAAGGKK